jgi:hypothetical protein
MRTILIDWLVLLQSKLLYLPETLHLAVGIIDRYLAKMQVRREDLQLVGVTAVLIACKYEEIYPPGVRDMVYVTDRTYTRQDVLDMEVEILDTLEFRISFPTAYPFLCRFLTLVDATPTVRNAANYYLDRMLQETIVFRHRPSMLAMAAVVLALNHKEIREHDGLTDDPPGVVSRA